MMTRQSAKADTATQAKEPLDLNMDDLDKIVGGSRSQAAPAQQEPIKDRYWVFYTH